MYVFLNLGMKSYISICFIHRNRIFLSQNLHNEMVFAVLFLHGVGEKWQTALNIEL